MVATTKVSMWCLPTRRAKKLSFFKRIVPQNRDKKTPKEKWDALIASLPFVRDQHS